MVTPEELEALDLMCWLAHGDDAALLGYCNQSTISRRSQTALRIFNLEPCRDQSLHQQAKANPFLRMEREVHQLYRLRGHGRLRLHAPYWASRLLENQLGDRWIVNPTRERQAIGEALTLLEHRVIDAMIAEASQHPGEDNPQFVCFDLYEVPLILCGDGRAEGVASEPLYGERNLSRDDVRGLTLVQPQPFLSPETKGCVVHLFDYLFGASLPAGDGCDRPLKQAAPVTFLMAHHPSVFEDFGHFRRIDCDCQFHAKESLVVLRDLAESSAIAGLLELLSRTYLPAMARKSSVSLDLALV